MFRDYATNPNMGRRAKISMTVWTRASRKLWQPVCPLAITKFRRLGESLRSDDENLWHHQVDPNDLMEVARRFFALVGNPERWQRCADARGMACAGTSPWQQPRLS